MSDLCDHSAVELASMIRQREVSARELLDACLARIDAVNPRLNAVVTLVPDRAAERADEADEAVARGDELGPLHGLPIAHKDLEPTAGIRTTMGSPIFADWVPDIDGLVVERLRAAGAVTIGKTNTPEFGAGSNTFNPVFGATRNPYDPSLTCGGSSGGAAVALATGMVPIADGSDMGGSLRNPASFCNVVGLRPSAGRVPSWPNRAPWSPLATAGAMARSVDDLALQMQALAGPDHRIPISLPQSGDSFAEVLTQQPADLTGLRVAWTPDLGLPVDRAVRDALAFVPDRLGELGCDVVDDAPDLGDAGEIFQVLRAWHFELAAGELYDRVSEQLKETVRWNVELGRSFTLTDHARAAAGHADLVERARRFFGCYDVLALPAVQVVPFPVETEWPTEIDGTTMPTYVDWMRSCSDITLTGCPAMSMPAAFTPDGLPVGVQFVGPPRSDVELMRFAKAWELAVPAGERRATFGAI
ncbi:amidase [Ilumatobacter fluminis]|uniref:Amidase n=1 Tax=Ilumatobacter fluminis TaxID=467091 RepID=A0A4R7I412_9ACTN|nr:amidase [Ilumatobacter fluminis]TDT17343.1 amidase [Ilumatobacter fluminis]